MRIQASLIVGTLLAAAVMVLPGNAAVAASIRYEAESSPAVCTGTIDSNWSGYSGSGFCNGTNAAGAYAQFTVSASTAGAAMLSLRYANGGATDRPADLIVNGSTIQNVSFPATGAWTTWVTTTLSVPVPAGTNTIRLSPTTAEGLANLDYLDVEMTSSPPPVIRYEAETSPAACTGTIDSNWSGFSGSGFCNGNNAVGATAQFTVTASAAGTATIGVRFANGSTAGRPADLLVNGVRATTVAFAGTGAWTTWATSTTTVSVNPGSNSIQISPTTSAGLPNVDYIEADTATSVGGNGSPTDANIQYYGRWNRSDPAYFSMGWAGGYLDARFTGSSIGVRQRNTIDLYYSIDQAPLQWRRGVSGNVSLATGLSGSSHTIRIGYREKAGSYTGDPVFGGLILASGAQTTAIGRPGNFVEFIGDSITVGQPNADRPFTAYPWLTAEGLGAGHSQVAQGGACLVSQDCYGMMDWFRRSSAGVSYDDWNFATYQATAVVINLGTNDVGHSVTSTQFQQGYVVMLERVRQAYPNAEIFAMGVFRARYVTETRNAVAARTAAGDGKVHFVDTTGWIDPTTDTSDNVHPTEAGHVKIAQRLRPILDQYI
ncbi:GDSL-type esterase/lipase family protein [Hamadaea sp. NPDC050747]|uniref:GDSL-type esterase/lipase family protein n=1 Tax=Hamadaea sp. NPDC050747 TaxID=3155789 RepID=UPI0033FBB0B2